MSAPNVQRHFNRQVPLWSPEARGALLTSRLPELDAFAKDRKLDASLLIGIAETTLRLGRAPDMIFYGLHDQDASAFTDLLNDAFLNTEDKASEPDAPIVQEAKADKISTKDPARMTAAEINKERAQLDKIRDDITDAFIDAGRGHETNAQIMTMTDPLAMRFRAMQDRWMNLSVEGQVREGPDAFRLGRKLKAGPMTQEALTERNDPLSDARRAAESDPQDQGAQGRLRATQGRLKQASGDLDLGERVTDQLGELILATNNKISNTNKQPLGDLYHEVQSNIILKMRRKARHGDHKVMEIENPYIPSMGIMLSNGPLALPGGFNQAVENMLSLEHGAPFAHPFFIQRMDLSEDTIATDHGDFDYDIYAENIHGRIDRGADGRYVFTIKDIESIHIVWSEHESGGPHEEMLPKGGSVSESADHRDSHYIQSKLNANPALRLMADRHMEADLKRGRAYFKENIRPNLMAQREESRQGDEIAQIGRSLSNSRQFWLEHNTKLRLEVGYRGNTEGRAVFRTIMEKFATAYKQAGYQVAWGKDGGDAARLYVKYDQKKIKAAMAIADEYRDILDDIALERINTAELKDMADNKNRDKELMRRIANDEPYDELYTDDDRVPSYEPRDESLSEASVSSGMGAFVNAFQGLMARGEDARLARSHAERVQIRSPRKGTNNAPSRPARPLTQEKAPTGAPGSTGSAFRAGAWTMDKIKFDTPLVDLGEATDLLPKDAKTKLDAALPKALERKGLPPLKLEQSRATAKWYEATFSSEENAAADDLMIRITKGTFPSEDATWLVEVGIPDEEGSFYPSGLVLSGYGDTINDALKDLAKGPAFNVWQSAKHRISKY